MRPLGLTGLREIALLGAHCDDLVIGMGGTIAALVELNPGLTVRALVLTGAGTPREAEEREALEAICTPPGGSPGSVTLDLTVHGLPDGRTPAHYDEVKNAVRDLARRSAADVVFAPQRHDAHQDHRLLAEVTPTEFRDHLVLGYEILKWETDTPRPTVFVPLTDAQAARKIDVLMTSYPSQLAHDWYTEDAFGGLLRLRGVQSRSTHAEGFLLEKALLDLGLPAGALNHEGTP